MNDVVAARLRQARNARRWTQADLSDAVAAIGFTGLDRITVGRIEKGQRKARVDELVALAVALDVSVLFLLVPARLEAELDVTPETPIPSETFLSWARGDGPLNTRNDEVYNFMAPGSWVVWTPGEPDRLRHGSGLTLDEAEDLAYEVQRRDIGGTERRRL